MRINLSIYLNRASAEKWRSLAPKWYNMHFDSFLRQIYALCDSFAGSAERGTLLLWNGGWSIRLAALEEQLRLSKVEEKCTVAEVLTKAIRYACTTSLAHAPPSLHFSLSTFKYIQKKTQRNNNKKRDRHVSWYANQPTTFPFSLKLIDFFFFMSLSSTREWAFNAQKFDSFLCQIHALCDCFCWLSRKRNFVALKRWLKHSLGCSGRRVTTT